MPELQRVAIFQLGDRQPIRIANGIVGNVAIAQGEDPDVDLGFLHLLERELDRVGVPFRRAKFHHHGRVAHAKDGFADLVPMLGQIHRRAADHDVQARVVGFDDDESCERDRSGADS